MHFLQGKIGQNEVSIELAAHGMALRIAWVQIGRNKLSMERTVDRTWLHTH